MTDRSDDSPCEEPAGTGRTPASPESSADTCAVLRRIEQLLVEIRAHLETATRAQQHRQFSAARLIGALLQVLTLALVVAALADWVYQAGPATQLIKLVFAGVVQLGALTAFCLARDEH